MFFCPTERDVNLCVFFIWWFVVTQLARPLHQEQFQVVCSNKEARKPVRSFVLTLFIFKAPKYVLARPLCFFFFKFFAATRLSGGKKKKIRSWQIFLFFQQFVARARTRLRIRNVHCGRRCAWCSVAWSSPRMRIKPTIRAGEGLTWRRQQTLGFMRSLGLGHTSLI